MKKSGFAKAFFGLLVGVVLGLAILAIKEYIAEQVVGLLDDEVRASCEGCKFVADSIRVSLLRLRVSAIRPRILQHNKSELEFKRIDAGVSLSRISEHVVLLSEVNLYSGMAHGVGPDSVTFKFIDRLTEPIAPERDYPGRWKVQLQNLQVFDSRLVEPFTRSELAAEGVAVDVQRDSKDNFWLRPAIQKLRVVSKVNPKNPPFELGKLSGQIYMGDGKARFKELSLAIAKSLIRGSALSHNEEDNRLEGKLAFNLDSSSYDLPSWLKFKLHGDADLSGSLGRPDIKGSFTNTPDAPGQVVTAGIPRASFDVLDGQFTTHVQRGESEVVLRKLDGESENASLRLLTPLSLKNNEVSGKIGFAVDSMTFEDATFYDLRGEVNLSEKDYDLKLVADARAAAVVSHGFTFRDVNTLLTLRGDDLDAQFSHQSGELGSFSARAKIRLNEEPARMTGLEYQYSDFALFQPGWVTQDSSWLNSLRFTGAGSLKGPIAVKRAEGSTAFRLSSTALTTDSTFDGSAELRDGVLTAKVEDKGGSLHSVFVFPLATDNKSKLTLHANHMRPEDLFPSLECLDFTGDVDYAFDTHAPWVGTGDIKVQGLQFGCAPYTVSLEKAATVRLNAGNASLPASSFKGLDSSVLIQGDISATRGFNVNAQGQLELNSLVTLLPAVDDLSGHIVATLDLKGPVTTPALTGHATVRRGEFAIESANLSASEISGDLTLSGHVIKVENLSGNLNGGTAQLKGILVPLEPEKSTLTLSAENVSVDPFPNTTLQLGGNLEMKELISGVPSVEGTVRIESGEFQRNLEVANLIHAVSDYIFTRARRIQQTPTLPRVDLNVTVSASRNLFMYTNWAGAEFRGDVSITGDINAPAIDGAIETISGWFGIRDRRFEITSGTVTFKPGSAEPAVEIIGETYVPSYTGDSTLIIAEARGSLSNPKITFASDRGLSEREILNLLAIGSNRGGQTLANTAARDLELQNEGLFDDASILNFPRFLSNLTRIDSLSLQPIYNVQTGLIEPSVVAEKKITDSLSLVGESTIGASVSESRLKLLYDLTSYLKLAGIAESVSTRQTNALGVDLTYTVLAKQLEFVKIVFDGNERLDKGKILKGIRLNVNSRVPPDEVSRLEAAVKDFYRDHGYIDATVSGQCIADGSYCREIDFHVHEGLLHRVKEITLEGDDVGQIVDLKKLLDVPRKLEASTETLAARRDGLVKRLRAEGYISARVTARYESEPGSDEAKLIINAKTGKPVSFVFVGNRKFSAEDFLETINLFNRKQPFGNNTINILIQNIERKYREAGYLYATISSTKTEEPATGRITYVVTIEEDTPTRVAAVTLSGNNSLSTEDLERLAGEISVEENERIFSPRYAVAEDIEQNISTLKGIYVEQGYPNTEITYQLKPLDEADKVEIRYTVIEGSEVRADWLALEGMPADISAPPPPPAPYSIPKANRYIDELLEVLRSRGFLKPALWSDIEPGSSRMTIHVQPGMLTRIGKILFESDPGISRETIQRNITIKKDGAWDADAINESKRKLLRLGLFSRVEISPVDGNLDSEYEDIVVRLSERPLTTLEVGTGINSEFGFHAFGEATDRGLFRDGRTLTLRADLYYDPSEQDISQGVAGLRYSDPYFLSTNFSLAEELRFEKLDLSTLEFNLDRISLSSFLYRSWDSGFSTSFGHTISEDKLTEVSPDAILSDLDRGNVRLSFLSAVFGYDRRNNPLNPTSGYNLNLDMKLANEALWSDANYFAVGGRGSLTAPVKGTRFSFAFNTRAASSWTYGGTQQIPITQRYYLGGRNSVRGFRENSLGPRGENGSILGGNILVSGSSEARYLVENNLSVHLFLDAGNVFLRGNDASSYTLRYSTGVGMRFLSPIGPIGFDIGHPLQERSGESSIRFHFNIGTSF